MDYDLNTNVSVSIIICCFNSAKRLPETLQHLMAQEVPAKIPWEVIVVDNGSSDNTSQIAKELWQSDVPFRAVPEPKVGLSNARNRGLRESKGNLICFIDDDVWPHVDWLKNMVEFAIHSDADAICGKVIIPNHLTRPWMEKIHRTKLASTENIDPGNPLEIIGANMAIKRVVLDKVPQFDPELGAGASGFGEESLFSRQVLTAGFKIGFAEKAVVEHHFEERRLLRSEWLMGEQKRGIGNAYITYNWEHKVIHKPLFEYMRNKLRLFRWRFTHQQEVNVIEGCSIEELRLVRRISTLKHYLIFRRKPRCYTYHGLVKLA